MDYENLIGQQVQTVANCRLVTTCGDTLYFNSPPVVRLVSYDHMNRTFTCDLQTGDEHDGKQVTMSDYAVALQLGIE